MFRKHLHRLKGFVVRGVVGTDREASPFLFTNLSTASESVGSPAVFGSSGRRPTSES